MSNDRHPFEKGNQEAEMVWSEVRKAYPDQWLVIEALEAHTEGSQRLLDRIAVIETCPDGASAMQRYQRLHRNYPLREFYYVHTSRENLDIRECHWIFCFRPVRSLICVS